MGITHLVYVWSHLIPVSGCAGFAPFIVLAVVASGVHSIVPVVRLLSRRLLVRASSSSEVSGPRGLERRAYSFLWLSVVRFLWGARLGTILSEVRVCSTGWLLVCNVLLDSLCVVGGRSEECACWAFISSLLVWLASVSATLCGLIGLWYSCGSDFHLGGFLSDYSGTTTMVAFTPFKPG